MKNQTAHFFESIPGWFTFEYLYKSIATNAKDGQHFVEIGAFLGKSTSYLAVEIKNSRKNIKLDVIDTWKGSPNEAQSGAIIKKHGADIYHVFIENMKKGGVLDIINPVRMDSVGASRLYTDESLDFVFIDADHAYHAVQADIRAWHPKVKGGGILAGDDYGTKAGVKQAVNEFAMDKKVLVTMSEDGYLHWLHQKSSDLPTLAHA